MLMLKQRTANPSGFRELTYEELIAASGGNEPLIYSGGLTVFGNSSSGTFSLNTGDYSVGDGAGGIGSGLSSFQFMDLAAVAGLADIDWEAFFDYMEALEQESQDLDGDGEPGITVTADGPLPDTFDEMTWSQWIDWNVVMLAGFDPRQADMFAGTNISGDNPNDVRNADRVEEIQADMIADGIENMLNQIPQ